MTVVRLWRATIDGSRAGEYEEFAAARSEPMFKAMDGCRGVLFSRRNTEVLVVTLWRDHAAVAALDDSPIYQETVRKIDETGFIVGGTSVETYQMHGGVSGSWAGCSG